MREGKSESEWAKRVVFGGLERQRVEALPWPLDFEESFGTLDTTESRCVRVYTVSVKDL